jgi:hypothetical protein
MPCVDVQSARFRPRKQNRIDSREVAHSVEFGQS